MEYCFLDGPKPGSFKEFDMESYGIVKPDAHIRCLTMSTIRWASPWIAIKAEHISGQWKISLGSRQPKVDIGHVEAPSWEKNLT